MRNRARSFVGTPVEAAIVLRPADGSEDDATIGRLAQLSGRRRPAGPMLIAEVDGEPRAALALRGGELLFDPFRPTAELGALLALRATQLEDAARAGRRSQAVTRRRPLVEAAERTLRPVA